MPQGLAARAPTTPPATGEAAELEAMSAEVRSTWLVVLVIGVLVLGLAAIAWLRGEGRLPLGGKTPVGTDDWTVNDSLASIILLLVAAQLTALLLAVEHCSRRLVGRLLMWGLRLVLLCALLVATFGWFLLRFRTDPGSIGSAAVVVEVAVLLCCLLVYLWIWPRATSRRPAARKHAKASREHEQSRLEDSPRSTSDRRLLAIGASGGGIRAAAFVLGGTQALQANASALEAVDPGDEPHIFAVSGGSYIGAAMAIRRRFAADGALVPADPGWVRTYEMTSPETERLRRHTRYLYEPGARLVDGAITLLVGAALNVLLVCAALFGLAWCSVTLIQAFGGIGPLVTYVNADEAFLAAPSRRPPAGSLVHEGLTWNPTMHGAHLAWLLAPSLVLLGVAGLVTLALWASGGIVDAPDDTAFGWQHAAADVALRGGARVRQVAVYVAVAWAVLAAGLPAAAIGVTALATGNQPTAQVAGLLHRVGFATSGQCRTALRVSVNRAVALANVEAAISPDSPRTRDAGACGATTTVSRTHVSKGTAQTGDDVVYGAWTGDISGLFEAPSAKWQLTTITTLLTLVIGLLRRGPSPESPANESRRSRLVRTLLTWLPLAITGGVAAYLVLLWTAHDLSAIAAPLGLPLPRVGAGVLAVAGVAGLLIDANSTSMHRFYRQRLSDAFAVGVDGDDAVELPPGKVYRFSDLGGARLHIVATVNTRNANEAPTMRGGFPLVFGSRLVHLHGNRGRSVVQDTKTFEDFAGPGHTSVMAAVAVSGAAISPLMGRFGVQMAPYRLLLALFNLRIGLWVRNPAHTQAASGASAVGLGSLYLTRKPGLAQMAREGFGSTGANDRWVYVTDGGHLDNTGLVECIRYAVSVGQRGRIAILDASNDPPGSWSAVGDAVAVVRADLAVDLRHVQHPDDPPWVRRYRDARFDVVVVKAVRVDPPTDKDRSADWSARLPPSVRSFQLVNAEFPRASTARQKFGDLEFEAYRALGYATTQSAMTHAGWAP